MTTYQSISEIITYEFKFAINYGQANYTPSPNAPTPKTIVSCPGEDCVYTAANYEEDLYYNSGDDTTTLTNYTKNYKSLRTTLYYNYENVAYADESDCMDYNSGSPCREADAQQYVILAYILDSNDKIQRGFVCRIFNGDTTNEKVLCLEGTRNGSAYSKNAKLIKKYFPDDYSEDGGTISGYRNEDDDYELNATNSGDVEIHRYNHYDCKVGSDGIIHCGEV